MGCINSKFLSEHNELNKQTVDSCVFFSLSDNVVQAKIVSVYDGDTCTAVFKFKGEYVKFKIRMYGYDSPEIKPSLSLLDRDQIIANAKKAKKELEKLILGKVVTLKCGEWDKYGRLLGHIYVGELNELYVNDYMIKNGFGYEYHGGTKQKII